MRAVKKLSKRTIKKEDSYNFSEELQNEIKRALDKVNSLSLNDALTYLLIDHKRLLSNRHFLDSLASKYSLSIDGYSCEEWINHHILIYNLPLNNVDTVSKCLKSTLSERSVKEAIDIAAKLKNLEIIKIIISIVPQFNTYLLMALIKEKNYYIIENIAGELNVEEEVFLYLIETSDRKMLEFLLTYYEVTSSKIVRKAVLKNDVKMVKMLVRSGAVFERLSIDLARNRGDKEMALFLEKEFSKRNDLCFEI